MTINPFSITGNIVFDYFFTLVMVMGSLSVVPGAIFKLFKY